MYLSRARKSKMEGFEYFVNNPIAIILSNRLVREAPRKKNACSNRILSNSVSTVMEKFWLNTHFSYEGLPFKGQLCESLRNY